MQKKESTVRTGVAYEKEKKEKTRKMEIINSKKENIKK